MKKAMKNIALAAAALTALLSCNKIEAWQDKDVTYPNRVHYSVATSEIVEEQDGVSVINSALMRYDISLTDDNSISRGSLSIVAEKDAPYFSGTYTLSSENKAGALLKGSLKDDNGTEVELKESVDITQNALYSLSFSVSGSNIVSFAKGSGVPQHQRTANTDCCAKYLINHTVPINGTYVHTLSIGSKGITCTEGQYYDTYSGTGDYLILKFVSAKENLAEGDWSAISMDSAAPEHLLAGKLIDSGYGFSYLDGSQFYTLKDGDTSPSTALPISGGNISIKTADAEKETFTVSGTLILSDGKIFTVSYTGRITPEPAPERDWNVYSDVQSDVYKIDWSTWQTELVPGIKQHTITILDPRDEILAVFTPILDENAENLSGEFTVAENAAQAGLMGNGYDATQWGAGIGGSYLVEDGDTYLINAGNKISISYGEDGCVIFKGTGASVTVNGGVATKDIEIKAYTKDYTK